MNVEIPKLQTKEEWIEALNSPEVILESFKEALNFIESVSGIKLTQIELVGLRRIVEKVMKEVYEQEKEYIKSRKPYPESAIEPHMEIVGRFFWEFYEIPLSDIDKLYKTFGEEKFQQFIRTKQEGKHLP